MPDTLGEDAVSKETRKERIVLEQLLPAIQQVFVSPEALALDGKEQCQLLVTAAAMIIKWAGNDPVQFLLSTALSVDEPRVHRLLEALANDRAIGKFGK